MDERLEVQGHSLWAEEDESSVRADSSASPSMGIKNLLYLVSGRGAYEKETVANITRVLEIPWSNAYCFSRDGAASTSTGATRSIASAVEKITNRLRKQRGAQKKPVAGGRAIDPRALIVIQHIDQFVDEHALQLDFLFSATGSSSIANEHFNGAAFLLTVDPLTLGPSADKNNDSYISLQEFKSFLANKLNNKTNNFNGEAFVGRVQRFAIEQRRLPDSSAPTPTDSLCAFIQGHRKEVFQSESIVKNSKSMECSFVDFLALISIPVIVFYAWQRWRSRHRLGKRLSRGVAPRVDDVDRSANDGLSLAEDVDASPACDTLPSPDEIVQTRDDRPCASGPIDGGEGSNSSPQWSSQDRALETSRPQIVDVRSSHRERSSSHAVLPTDSSRIHSRSIDVFSPDSSSSVHTEAPIISPTEEVFSRLQAPEVDIPPAETTDQSPPAVPPPVSHHSSEILSRSVDPPHAMDADEGHTVHAPGMRTRSRAKAEAKTEVETSAATRTRRTSAAKRK